MKNKLLPFCFLLFSSWSFSQGPRLIIRGDDMGFSHSGNMALIKSFKEGVETSIEVIVPSPWFTEAVKLLKQNPGVDVGIHLAITSEWENIKWRPMTDCPSIKDSNGYFFPMIYPNKNYLGQSVKESNWKIEDVEKEFRAQMETALKYLPKISHISSHMGCVNMDPKIKEMTQRLAEEYKVPLQDDLSFDGFAEYEGPHETSQQKIESFIKMLNNLEEGKTYIFIDHPGINNDELKAIFHIGYENVAEDRQGVTDVYTSRKIKNLIKQKGIQLIGYKDLSRH